MGLTNEFVIPVGEPVQNKRISDKAGASGLSEDASQPLGVGCPGVKGRVVMNGGVTFAHIF